VDENLLQGVHRSRFRLSVEESVQRNPRNPRSKAQEGEWWKSSRKKSLKSSLKISGKIHSQREMNDSRPSDLGKLRGG
jgi:hypothetical protein